MRKLYIIIYLLLNYSLGYAQNLRQATIISIDTINIRGKVIDIHGEPVNAALVLSETLDRQANYIQAKTDANGFFRLNGVKPTDWLRFRKNEVALEYALNGSRNVLVVMTPLTKLHLNMDGQLLTINAKRISLKNQFRYPIKDTLFASDRHPFGYYVPANYPGGLNKFYEFIKTNLVYPKKAIKNNIEGLVSIAFTIDVDGNYQDFKVLRDIGYGCADNILEVIKKSKKWNSALLGIPVNQRISLDIPFKLVD